MRTVAFETSGPVGSVCLAEEGSPPVERSFEKGMAHGRLLIPVLNDLCAEAGWEPGRDIELVAVSLGPGSFTGLRVAVAAAKTIAFTRGCPVVGISSLDVLAENAPTAAERVCAVVDAKRGQVYAAIYDRIDGVLSRRAEDVLATPAEVLASVEAPAALIGNGLAAYPEAFSAEGYVHVDESAWMGRAAVVAEKGLAAFRAGRSIPWRELTPIYHRRPEAEEKRLQREGTLE